MLCQALEEEDYTKLHLEMLDLSDNGISIVSMPNLCHYIEHHGPWLKTLDLSYNYIRDESVQMLGKALKLRHLHLLEKVNFAYHNNLPLRNLCLSKVKMSDKGFWTLINVFKEI